MRSKRFGRFTIDWNFIDDNPELVKSIMAECIIVRAESYYHSEDIRYTAISDQFAEVEVGASPLTYSIEVTKYTSPHTGRVSCNWRFT